MFSARDERSLWGAKVVLRFTSALCFLRTFLRLSKLPNGVWCEGRQEESGRGEQRGQVTGWSGISGKGRAGNETVPCDLN